MAKCFSSIAGHAIDIIEADDCGRPVDLTKAEFKNSRISTAGWVSLSLSPDIETGETYRKRLANGEYCINNNEDEDRTMGLNATLMLCDISPYINELLACYTLLTNANNEVIGAVMPDTVNGHCGKKVLMSIYTENGNKKECDENGNAYPWIRWILPISFKWHLTSDITFEHGGTVEWELSGYVESNSGFTAAPGDQDITPEIEAAIQAGGPLAFLCTKELPPLVNCGYSIGAPANG